MEQTKSYAIRKSSLVATFCSCSTSVGSLFVKRISSGACEPGKRALRRCCPRSPSIDHHFTCKHNYWESKYCVWVIFRYQANTRFRRHTIAAKLHSEMANVQLMHCLMTTRTCWDVVHHLLPRRSTDHQRSSHDSSGLHWCYSTRALRKRTWSPYEAGDAHSGWLLLLLSSKLGCALDLPHTNTRWSTFYFPPVACVSFQSIFQLRN